LKTKAGESIPGCAEKYCGCITAHCLRGANFPHVGAPLDGSADGPGGTAATAAQRGAPAAQTAAATFIDVLGDCWMVPKWLTKFNPTVLEPIYHLSSIRFGCLYQCRSSFFSTGSISCGPRFFILIIVPGAGGQIANTKPNTHRSQLDISFACVFTPRFLDFRPPYRR